jgi:heat shock protein HslJ
VSVTENGIDVPLVPGSQLTLTFEAARFGAHAGCNSIGGDYAIENGTLVTSNMAWTEMYCGNGLDEQEQRFIALLGSHPLILVAGDELTLTSGTMTARFRDTSTGPGTPLVGTTWVVSGVITIAGVTEAPAYASLVFGADGRVALNAGCNRGGASYRVDANQITFGPLALTKMACPGPRAEMEQAVVATLGVGTLGYDIAGDVLTISIPDLGLQLTAE